LTRVLLIDDDKDLTAVLKILLYEAGFEVNSINSSPEGIETARHWLPDAIILDMVMPVLDGLQACQAIRQFSDVPILVLSVINKPELIAQALDGGADDYLSKPVASGVLIAHLNKLIRRNRVILETPISKNLPLSP
jgi:DNA-binding response OmpR family regulator